MQKTKMEANEIKYKRPPNKPVSVATSKKSL